MLERENIIFYDVSNLKKTEGMESRCSREYLSGKLSEKLPEKEFGKIIVERVRIITDGTYKAGERFKDRLFMKKLSGLPPFCEVYLKHATGKHFEEVYVFVPFAWNDRFAGTAGGGTGTGGYSYITRPDNTTRGLTMGYALMNGFTAATADGRNVDGLKDHVLNPKTGEFDCELYDNWCSRTTHDMTILGKVVAEILHERPVKYAYMNGGSGGGRQSVVEAQNYPKDYDGIWASCPAINWNKFLLGGLWYTACMNEYQANLTPEKLQFFTKKVWEAAGGEAAYYKKSSITEINPFDFVGEKIGKQIITKQDAKAMKAIWDGPHDRKGNRLWYSHRPGVKNWNVGIPVGAIYYSLIRKKPKLFHLSNMYLRWITKNPKQYFEELTIDGYVELYQKSIEMFADCGGDEADLSAFKNAGGKLMIDHGLNDPLIPVDGTIDYYRRVIDVMGGKQTVDEFMKLYLTPGDGHGNCWYKGPGITESAGMSALINWVENGEEPKEIQAVRVDKKKSETIEMSLIAPQ